MATLTPPVTDTQTQINRHRYTSVRIMVMVTLLMVVVMMIMVIMMMMVTMNDIVGGLHYEQSDPQPTLLCRDHTRPGHLSNPSYDDEEEVDDDG